MRRAIGVSLACLLVAGLACQTPTILRPDPKLYPCGVGGQLCKDGACCWSGFVCGGDEVGCPSGVCCFVGAGQRPGPGLDAGAQWSPR